MKDLSLIENRIWKYRNVKGFKQEDLAFLIGQNNPSQVSRYERGVAIPKLKYLIKLCTALDINIEYLYPHLTGKWHQEVKNRIEQLKNYQQHEQRRKRS
jgi:transcriptional regulator with XRE-family HTH domain